MADEKKKQVVGEVLLKDVRLSFADIFQPGKPQKNDEGETVPGKYKANGLMEKGTEQTKKNIAAIQAAAIEAKKAKWGDDEKKWPKLKPEKVCLRDGDLEDWDGYEGCFYISANNASQPVLITRRKDDKGNWIEAKPGEIYSGCYVNMLVRIWAMDNEHGKRVNASLEAVQFNRRGEPFSGAAPVDPNEKFAGIEADDGEAMGDDAPPSEDEDETAGLV